ncbi:MAG: subclass B1 metallo-beta-lactamase [Thalassotalea sp.]
MKFSSVRELMIFCLLFAPFIQAKSEPSIAIKPIAENVYQHISYQYVEPYGLVPASGLIVIDGSDAHIIDTPWSTADTYKLIVWLGDKGLTIKSAIATHFHDDASSGIEIFNQANIKTYATALTNQLLTSTNKTPAHQSILQNPYQLIEGRIEVFYPGAGHSQDNIVVWLPKSKILFGGCFVKSLASKSLGNIGDAVINSWPASIDKVIQRYPQLKLVVPGHGKVGDISLLTHTQKLALLAQKPVQEKHK